MGLVIRPLFSLSPVSSPLTAPPSSAPHPPQPPPSPSTHTHSPFLPSSTLLSPCLPSSLSSSLLAPLPLPPLPLLFSFESLMPPSLFPLFPSSSPSFPPSPLFFLSPTSASPPQLSPFPRTAGLAIRRAGGLGASVGTWGAGGLGLAWAQPASTFARIRRRYGHDKSSGGQAASTGPYTRRISRAAYLSVCQPPPSPPLRSLVIIDAARERLFPFTRQRLVPH